MRDSRLKSTPWYEYLNMNPRNLLSEDCLIRAVALVTEQSWEQTIRELTELGIKKSRVCNDSKLMPDYLESKGFKAMPEPRDAYNKKMTIKEFLCANPEFKDFICFAGSHHVTAVKDGKVRDIWDSSKVTMHRWWRKV